jgi:hypothetical protein
MSRYAAILASLLLLAGCHASDDAQTGNVAADNGAAAQSANAQAADNMAVEPLPSDANTDANGAETSNATAGGDNNLAQLEAVAQQITDRNNRSIAEADTVINGIQKYENEDPQKLRRLEADCRAKVMRTDDEHRDIRVLDCIKSSW